MFVRYQKTPSATSFFLQRMTDYINFGLVIVG